MVCVIESLTHPMCAVFSRLSHLAQPSGAYMRVPSKKLIALGLLSGGYLRAHFDPRHPGVTAPPHVRSMITAAFDYGEDAPLVVPEVTEEGLSATLLFQGVSHVTYVPWDAVFMLATPEHGATFWPDSVPPDAVETVPGEPPLEAAAVGCAPAGRRERPAWLRLVD